MRGWLSDAAASRPASLSGDEQVDVPLPLLLLLLEEEEEEEEEAVEVTLSTLPGALRVRDVAAEEGSPPPAAPLLPPLNCC